jgi:hypothetical protein
MSERVRLGVSSDPLSTIQCLGGHPEQGTPGRVPSQVRVELAGLGSCAVHCAPSKRGTQVSNAQVRHQDVRWVQAGHQNVPGPQVPVEDSMVVKVLHPLHHLLHDVQDQHKRGALPTVSQQRHK